MSEMYPPPPPGEQSPQQPGNVSPEQAQPQQPPAQPAMPSQPYFAQWPQVAGAAPSQPLYSQQPPMSGAPPSQPLYPPQPGLPGTHLSQPFNPQQPPNMGAAPSQPLYGQQPPMGFAGYPGGGAPGTSGYVKTNVVEYWKNAKNGKRNLSILVVVWILLAMCGGISSAASSANSATGAAALTTSGHNSTSNGNQGSTASQPTYTPVPAPTDTPVPPPPTDTPTPHLTSSQYMASAKRVTVAGIAKDPNTYKGKTIMFDAVILNFVQDSSGNTAGANVVDPNDYSSFIQIEFTPGFSVANVNKGDTVAVWGQGMGAFSGTNAYGGTITEGAVQEVYLHDDTNGYNDSSVTDPSSYTSN